MLIPWWILTSSHQNTAEAPNLPSGSSQGKKERTLGSDICSICEKHKYFQYFCPFIKHKILLMDILSLPYSES